MTINGQAPPIAWTRRLRATLIDLAVQTGLILLGLALLIPEQEGLGISLIVMGMTLDIVCSSPLTARQSLGRYFCHLTLHGATSHPWSAAIARGLLKWAPWWLVSSAAWLLWSMPEEALFPIISGLAWMALAHLLLSLLLFWMTPTHRWLHDSVSRLRVDSLPSDPSAPA